MLVQDMEKKRSINGFLDLKRCPYCVSDLIKKEPHGREAWMIFTSGWNYWIVAVYRFCSAMVLVSCQA